jgi:hypothetical protein
MKKLIFVHDISEGLFNQVIYQQATDQNIDWAEYEG